MWLKCLRAGQIQPTLRKEKILPELSYQHSEDSIYLGWILFEQHLLEITFVYAGMVLVMVKWGWRMWCVREERDICCGADTVVCGE